MSERVALSRTHRDLLDRLSFRYPDPCFLVPTQGGCFALVVTEVSTLRSLSRLKAYSGATVRWVRGCGLVSVLEESRMMAPYSGRRPADCLVGHQVWITPRGFWALGRPTMEERSALLELEAAKRREVEGSVRGPVVRLEDECARVFRK